MKKENTLKDSFQKLLALGALVILFIFFSIFGKNFFSVDMIINILEAAYFIGFLALGVTFVIITGGIDLSIGTVMMCGALIGGAAFIQWGLPLWAGLAIIVVVCTIFGLINGFLIARMKLPPFIATLGMMLISQGFGSIVTGVQTMRYPTLGTPDAWFKEVFYKVNGFPVGIIYLGVFFLLAMFLLNKTKFGRYVFAMGSNEEAARLSGINVKNWKMLVYTVCGFFAGMAGIFYAATYTSILPGTGNGMELQAISGVVIGGTSLAGGVGTMAGTMIGVFIMSVLRNGLMSMGLQSQWQVFFTGVVVIGAVLLDIYRTTKSGK